MILLFNRFLNPTGTVSKKIIISLISVYIISILSMSIPALFGIIEMNYHLQIIKITAPLVAFPMGFAFYLSVKNYNTFERKILIPSTMILFIFQLNDLLMFWQIIDSYYTVKFYIPFVIAILIFIFLFRKIEESKKKDLLAAKFQIVMQVAHDIKSPVSAINTAVECLEHDQNMAKEILSMSVDRLNSITKSLLPGYNKKQKINLNECILEVISEKKYQVSFNLQNEGFLYGTKSDIQRMISNLLDNAHEANKEGKIEVSLSFQDSKAVLSIIDNGPGITKIVLNNIGKMGNTFGKENGSGLGLSFMTSVINDHNAKYKINSSSSGTQIDLIFDRFE